MSILDVGIILLLIMFLISGFKKGIIKSAVSFMGFILIFVIAFIFKGYVGNVLCKYLPFFNFSGSLDGVISINILLYQFIAFFLIYLILSGVYSIILKLSGVLQKLINYTIILLIPSKLGGAVVSLIEGYLIIFALLLTLMIPFKDSSLIKDSNLASKIVYDTPVISKWTGSITNSIDEIYMLGEKLAKKELTTNEANLETIDVMLKYKIVDKKTIEQLVVLDKLKGITNLDRVLGKY